MGALNKTTLYLSPRIVSILVPPEFLSCLDALLTRSVTLKMCLVVFRVGEQMPCTGSAREGHLANTLSLWLPF